MCRFSSECEWSHWLTTENRLMYNFIPAGRRVQVLTARVRDRLDTAAARV